MAIMIPPKPKEYNALSGEGIIFDSLEKLSDQYYVFHSFQITDITPKGVYESETDFVIFHPQKGIIAIEAKSGGVRYESGQWLYESGLLMKHDGPFNQARGNMYNIQQYIKKKNVSVYKKMAFIYAVCFPSLDSGVINTINFPSDSPRELVIGRDQLDNIENAIDKVYSHIKLNYRQAALSDSESRYIVNNILCPTFNLIPAKSFSYYLNEQKFNYLLREQQVILNFLEEQRSAVISGSAGTGKTMIALEKARRHASNKERVLFLCYNKKLQEHLNNMYKDKNIDYYTIDKFAYTMTRSSFDTYRLLKDKLVEIYVDDLPFEYDHVVIDEGQDFGQKDIEEQEIIQTLSYIMQKKDGTFYIFYDKYQLVQGFSVPKYIQDADCKLTLYMNCRNTYSIAKTSMRLLDKKPILRENCVVGDTPAMYRLDKSGDINIILSRIVKKLNSMKITDIVILTVKTIQESILASYIKDEFLEINHKNYYITTTRKFKGLEADAIILVDIDSETICNDALLFYVGSSRAKHYLYFVANLSVTEEEILSKKLNLSTRKSFDKQLASYLYSLMER